MQPNEWFARYQAFSKHETHHVLLESGQTGNYSVMGVKPSATISAKNGEVTIQNAEETIVRKGKVLPIIKEWLAAFDCSRKIGMPDYYGGVIGYFSYDIVREIEKLPSLSEDDLALPDVYLYMFDELFVYDHKAGYLWMIVYFEDDGTEAEQRLLHLKKAWEQQPENIHQLAFERNEEVKASVSLDEAAFSAAVLRIQDYIAAGDVFQVNLSVRQTQPLKTHPMAIYEQLRHMNPSPYMGYFHSPEFQLVSASPELLVKKKERLISTRPIAGTRSRGKTPEEDAALAATLIENEKERAEHVMLVDLERNDLGKVSEYGSVYVDEFMTIEKYSHVMHIVSNVQGILRQSSDAYDLLEATFPGGTITGAPKIRTMEIIEELEPVRRGVYTGSIGWIGFDGDMEMNIAIRTMVCQDGAAHVQAGAGVVIDSNPKAEYKESLKKAAALWRAKELAEEAASKTVEKSRA
ncbi:aminodeoxychorismate synthase, component I [Fictibacillus macauensis]|nr:aminodeoxychorismate synthase, component I [Fictibacillus macauensis]